jgi:ribose/xylose/arabinose/galactoside ABC-type transport system permease subunit
MSKTMKQNLMLLLVLAAMFLFFSLGNGRFASLYNVTNLFRQSLPNIILGCTMTFVISSGAIDLSVGGTMALSALFYGNLCIWGVNAWMTLPLIILLGAVVGIANTLIMEKLHIPGIMATLATWIITSGLAFTVCRAIPIASEKYPQMNPIKLLNSAKVFGNIPIAVLIAFAVVLIFLFLEKKTVLKYSIAIGGNEMAARLSGINVLNMRMIFFVLSGVAAALSGIWQVARLGSADPTIGTGMEFNVLAASILGGVNIKGGEGSITGVFLGTLILMVLINGMQMMGVGSFYQTVATGIVLYLAVLLNAFIGRFGARKLKVAENSALAGA